MTPQGKQGFTIIEVLIAIVMLTIGVLALSASAGSVTRMMDSGRNRGASAALAASLLDSLRSVARRTSPQCTGLANGTLTINPPERGFTASWTVAPGGLSTLVTVTVGYQVGPATKSDVLQSTFYCRP